MISVCTGSHDGEDMISVCIGSHGGGHIISVCTGSRDGEDTLSRYVLVHMRGRTHHLGMY